MLIFVAVKFFWQFLPSKKKDSIMWDKSKISQNDIESKIVAILGIKTNKLPEMPETSLKFGTTLEFAQSKSSQNNKIF